MAKNVKKQSYSYSQKTLKRMLTYAKPHFMWFFICLVLIVSIVALELYQPIILGTATDYIIANASSNNAERNSQIFFLAGRYFGIVLLSAILTYAQTMILAFIGQKIILNIRLDVFKHLQKLSLKFFTNNPIGVLVTRATNDIEALNEMYTSVIVNMVKSVCMLVGIIITMLLYNIQLSLITFSIIPFIIITTVIFSFVSKRIYRAVRVKISELNAFVSEHVSGIKLVQIFSVEQAIFKKFKLASESLRLKYAKQVAMHAFYSPTSFICNIVTLIMLMWFGGKMVIAGEITIGTIVIFQRYISKFFEPIQEFSEQFNIIQSASAAAEKIFTLLDEKPEIENTDNPIELTNIQGNIEFKNVWFAYKENEWVLKDVSFKVQQGHEVAFVGNTGSGKTTILLLLARYYDIQKGEIFIDGINIKNIKINSLRKNIGQMMQDVFLFTGDVKSNIRLRNDEISDEDVIKVSKYVNADTFISQFKHGYNESVTERGSTFSVGQRQLLSFARTLAFSPAILTLDEATANIDTETELLIQNALVKLTNKRTTLVVAHRLSTIQHSNNIIVLHKGRIVEQGTHQELLKNKDLYYKLYTLQYN